MKKEKEFLKGKDGATISLTFYEPEQEAKGAILMCHGFGEHMGQYEKLATFLAENGYVCSVHNQRGHGEISPKERGIIPSYESFLDDIETVKTTIGDRYPNLPLSIYGHSMGGNIVANYLLKKGQEGFESAILETPWIRLYKPMNKAVEALASVLGSINKKWAIVNKLDENLIARKEPKGEKYSKDPWYHNRISFLLFSEVTKGGEYVLDHASEIKIPTFLVCAKKDKIVSPDAIELLKEKGNEFLELKVYEDAYHAVHNDIVWQEYYEDLLEFLSRR